MTTTLAEPPLEARRQSPTEVSEVSELKSQIEQRDYNVDAALVAEAILRKLRLVKWARRELVSEAGRTPGRPAPRH